MFSCSWNVQITFVEKPQLKKNYFSKWLTLISNSYLIIQRARLWIDKLHHVCMKGLLEITLTVPFIIFISLWIIKGRKDLYLWYEEWPIFRDCFCFFFTKSLSKPLKVLVQYRDPILYKKFRSYFLKSYPVYNINILMDFEWKIKF